MILVVGGSSRKAGKTTVMCEIIAATKEAAWTAIKMTSHAHHPTPRGDTERYLEAGAVNAALLPPGRLEEFQGNIIVESNSILDLLAPDLFVFVQGSGEQKPSARGRHARADVIVEGHATPELLVRIAQQLNLPLQEA